MRRDQIKRRVLYGVTAVAWGAAGYFLTLDLRVPEDTTHRTLMILVLTVAAVLSTASLFVFFLPTNDMIYRAGMEAGKRASGCSAFRPILTAMDGQRGGGTVTKIRVLHTDN